MPLESAGPEQRPQSSRRKRVVLWLMLFTLILAPIVVAEGTLRWLGLGDPILYYTNASYRFAQQPNQKRTRLRGATVSIDSKGLRSARDWTSPADAKILFVGDSVTWGGTYIDDADVFSQGTCTRLEQALVKRFVCGSASANGYGTDNMAARIRFSDVDDEAILVVTLIARDTVRGSAEADGQYLFTKRPPGPFRALWELATFATWRVFNLLRPLAAYRSDDDLKVADRSLDNLFAALRETARPSRKVLIVLAPIRDEVGGRDGDLTRHVRAALMRSGFEVLDLHPAVSAAIGPDFYYDALHPDVRGHHVYAQAIAGRLEPMLAGQ